MPMHAPEAAPLTIISETVIPFIATSTSEDESGPFEGPEKLLEIWFAPTTEEISSRDLTIKGERRLAGTELIGLRQVERRIWEEMLDVVQCKVLSVIEGEEVDAYLLSESSMFVWPHKLILKTCGTTTLLLGLPKLLSIAKEICGLNNVFRCFYSRKTFMFPDKQKGPHRRWEEEMGFLDELFDNSSAYTVGKMNGDHWLLYLTPPQDDNDTQSNSPTSPLTTLSSILPSLPKISPPDQTLEILMSRLAPSTCREFYHPSSVLSTSTESASIDSHQLGSLLSKKLGLKKLLPNATEDAFLFSPCGFSSNSIQGDRYATIHVTPEEEFSYASFETNLTFGDGLHLNGVTGLDDEDNLVVGGPTSLPTLVEAVLEIFKPAKLSITLFVSSDSPSTSLKNKKGRQDTSGGHGMEELLNDELLDKCGSVDKIVYEFIGYRLVCAVDEEL